MMDGLVIDRFLDGLIGDGLIRGWISEWMD